VNDKNEPTTCTASEGRGWIAEILDADNGYVLHGSPKDLAAAYDGVLEHV